MSERLTLTSEALAEVQRHVADGLAKIDPHHRLLGRPVCYRVIDSQAFEITFHDVTGIAVLRPESANVGRAPAS